jgi:hypothetical protein
MAQGQRQSVCASRIRGSVLSSDPRADHGTGFWHVAATGAGLGPLLRAYRIFKAVHQDTGQMLSQLSDPPASLSRVTASVADPHSGLKGTTYVY